ncbi:hypothetical protein [Pseudolysinimonas sp.]|jgi:hypothetical protein|uniref:hypothetical protein n=1 Tax=Pseudolysinimonas sp. TaxID=2680009 RepID=UPI0037849095
MPEPLLTREYQRITPDGIEPVGDVSKTYLVVALEIVVRHHAGVGLLLRFHSYPRDPERVGYWASPSLQMDLDFGVEPEVAQAAFYNQVERRIARVPQDIETEAKHFAESFGLRDPELRRVGDMLLERKAPISGLERHSAYATIRFRVDDIDPRSHQNLLDPEGRHGFVVLPLDDLDRNLQDRKDPDGSDEDRFYFLGKPLISGLDHLIRTPRELVQLREEPIDVRDVPARAPQHGLIACADIAGYGAALSLRLSSLNQKHVDERRGYRRRILGMLETALAQTGTTQIQSAGDGFVAGYPCSADADHRERSLLRVIEGWTSTLQRIEEHLNPFLKQNRGYTRLGSRMAISAGDYSWGRINGLTSFYPAFDGDAIIQAARMEQSLRNGMYSASLPLVRRPPLVMQTGRHYLALGSELASAGRAIERDLLDLDWTIHGSAHLWAKQKVFRNALILEWNPGAPDGD